MSISFRDVSFSYDPGASPLVIDRFDLDVEDGEYVALLGRNGCGKSTVARLSNGLLEPTSGTVLVDGFTTAAPESLPQVRAALQLVFQNPENQQVGTTVFDDIAFGLSNFAVPTALMRGRAEEALELVGLDVELDRDVNALSGGELQRLALASVLSLRPHHLVLDEVTSMLDPGARLDFSATLRSLRAARPLTVLQITHHLQEVEHADRAVVLIDGHVAAQGTPSIIFADADLLAAAGLEAPYRWQHPEAGPTAARLGEEAPVSGGGDGAGTGAGTGTGAGVGGGAEAGAGAGTTVSLRGVSLDYAVPRPPRRGLWRSRRTTGSTLALRDIDLEVGGGALVAIAGRSGAGKSTLVSTIKGLLAPVCGTLAINDLDPWANRTPQTFDTVGILLQRPEHQLFAPTVRQDVGYGLGNLDDTKRRRVVDTQLTRLGLDPDEVGERSPFGLSGGQQRRVAIAGVLATDPRVLILDEPTAGLDLPSRTSLFEILRSLRAQGVTILWVSHRLEEIHAHADRLIVVDEGRILVDGDPRELLADATVRARVGWPLIEELDPDVIQGEALVRGNVA